MALDARRLARSLDRIRRQSLSRKRLFACDRAKRLEQRIFIVVGEEQAGYVFFHDFRQIADDTGNDGDLTSAILTCPSTTAVPERIEWVWSLGRSLSILKCRS